MVDNEKLMASEVDRFYREAQKRGIYTQTQDSLASAWKTLSTTVLPAVGVEMSKIAVGDLRDKLPELLQNYGAKTDVKASTIQTYEAKGSRLLTDFVNYNNATDSKWFEWKQKNEKRSQQASAAASSRFNGRKSKEEPASEPAADDGPAPSRTALLRHPLRLPGSRTAELHVPSDLKVSDIRALELGFNALIGYLKSQIQAQGLIDNEESTQDT